MRLIAIGLLSVLVACSSGDSPPPAETATRSASPPSPSAQTSLASLPSSVSAAPASSAAPDAPMRDADAELAGLDPFNEAAPDRPRRLRDALALCGEPRITSRFDGSGDDAPWGRDVPEEKPVPTKPGAVSRCAPESHAKLFMQSAVALSEGTPPADAPAAEVDIYYALALDPHATLPAGASAAAKTKLDAVKHPKRFSWSSPDVRVREVVGDGQISKSELEKAAQALTPTVRLCFASGLRNNPNLQGTLTLQALVDADGRLSDIRTIGSLPDNQVLRCVRQFAARSKLAPANAGAKPTIRFDLVPNESPRK